jgi:hypothetical protein
MRRLDKYQQKERQVIGDALCTKDYKVVLLELEVSHYCYRVKIDKLRYKAIA